MSIRQRGNSWVVDITSPVGGRYRRQFNERTAAELWDARTRLAFSEGATAPPSLKASGPPIPKTLGELVERTRQRYWQEAKSIKTIDSNLKTMLDYFGEDYHLPDMTHDAAEDYVAHLDSLGNLGAATVNRKLAVLSRVLIFAHRRGWIKEKIDIPRKKEGPGRVRFYTDGDMALMLRGFNELGAGSYGLLYAFLCDTGLRLGEALSLPWEDATDGRVTVWEHKGAKPGGIPCTSRVKDILKVRGVSAGNLEGPWADMTVNTTRYAMKKLRKWGMNEGVDTYEWLWHTCRHTFVTRLIQRGVPTAAVRDLARHRDINTTMRYTHLAPRDYNHAISLLEPDHAD